MALCSSTATTVESTPPDSAQITWPSPTVSRLWLTTRSTKELMLQSASIFATRNRKLRSMASPSALCDTSGWN